jgi:hypothetical protein
MKSLLTLIVLAFSFNALALDRYWCGEFKEVTFKAQKFIVVNEQGQVFPKTVHAVKAGADEAQWNGEDWGSAAKFWTASPQVTFDEKTGVYTVAEFKIKPKSRWKILAGCLDVVVPLSFKANAGKRESGVNVKYHEAEVYLSLADYKNVKKPVVPANDAPHVVVLKQHEIVEGSIISKPDVYAYEVKLDSGETVTARLSNYLAYEEKKNVDNAFEGNRRVRLYGIIHRDEDQTRFFYSYADAL